MRLFLALVLALSFVACSDDTKAPLADAKVAKEATVVTEASVAKEASAPVEASVKKEASVASDAKPAQ